MYSIKHLVINSQPKEFDARRTPIADLTESNESTIDPNATHQQQELPNKYGAISPSTQAASSSGIPLSNNEVANRPPNSSQNETENALGSHRPVTARRIQSRRASAPIPPGDDERRNFTGR
jgi:hypothetical protein